MELIDKFRKLPQEIIISIIPYTDVIVYRNGKFINRLQKKDERYNLIYKIPRPIYIGPHKILLRLMNCIGFGYFIEYYICDYLTRVNMRFFYKENDGIHNHYDIKNNNTYIIGINNKWFKIFNYTM